MNSDLSKETGSSDANKSRPKKYQLFVPFEELLKKSYTSGNKLITKDDVFLSHRAFRTFSSLFSKDDVKLPQYMVPYKDIINNVTNFSEKEMDEINSCQMQHENLKREEEQIEAKKVAEREAYELQIKSSLDKKVNMIMKRHKYYVKRMCPVKIPFKSTLNHQEHEFYLRSFIKFQIRPYKTKHEEEEYNQYVSLQNRLFDEQSALMNFSYKVSQLVLNEYNTVSPTIENYVNKYVNHRCKRIFAYPQYYRTEMKIPIKPQDHIQLGCSLHLKHLGHLLSLGTVPVMKIPYPCIKNTLPIDESVETKRRPDGDTIFDQNLFLYKCPVSKDPNAEFLVQEHNASIVISASAFKTIVDNQEQPFDNYWNIPVSIKSYKVKDDQGKEKFLRVVYIDKPLPKMSWYPLEMKSNFLKQSALGHLTYLTGYHSHKMNAPVLSSHSQESRGDNKSIYDDDVFGGASEEVSDFFEIGFSSSLKSNSPLKKQKSRSKESSLPRYPYYHSPNSPTSEVASKSNLEDDLFLTDDDDDDDEDDSSRSSPKSCDGIIVQSKTPVKNVASLEIKKQFDSSKELLCHEETKIQDLKNTKFLENSSMGSKSINDDVSFQSTSSKCANSKEEVTESPGLLDNLLDMQKSFLKRKFEGHLDYGQCSSSISSSLIHFEDRGSPTKGNLNKLDLKPWSQTIHTEWSKCNNLKYCPFNKNHATNVHYQLYQFENIGSSPKKEESEPLKIIIRHNIHGMSKSKFDKKKKFELQNQKAMKAYIVYPKLENQVYFGAEVNSYSEITQQWASLVIRPNTTLLQVRVCVASGSIILTEERTLETVLKEGKQNHIKFDPQAPLATLNVLFRCLTKMPSGQYMIHHSLKTEAFISIMKACDGDRDVSQNNLDTHSIYSNGSIMIRQYKVSPWLNIDTHVLTPFHLVHKKIPATFPMDNPNLKLSKQARKKKRQAADKKKSIDEDMVEPKKKREGEIKHEKKSKRRYF